MIDWTGGKTMLEKVNRMNELYDTYQELLTSKQKVYFELYYQDDLSLSEIAEQFGQYLGKGLAVIAAVVNPEAFVIGGGVSKAGDILCQYITKYYEKYVFHGCRNAQFKLATLGNDAGIYGAARLVL